MQPTGWNDVAVLDTLLEKFVPFINQLAPLDRDRLREMALNLQDRGMPPAFVGSSLRSTAEVLRDLRSEEDRSDNVFRREEVRRFIEDHAVTEPSRPDFHPRRERKREEREVLQAYAARLLREARTARGRHEVKKTRNMLLKLDQREIRRVLGKEGEELCRQINTWLRSTAAMF